MSDCIFCKIVQGQISVPRLFENDDFIAIKDIQPQAATHFLVIPKKHIPSLIEAVQEEGMLGRLFSAVVESAAGQSLKNGFRTVINTGEEGGQTVSHLHVHVLSSRNISGRFG